ncbi:MAG: nucleoside-diphosphate kinase [Microgenomates group bacterium Gr01-1014_16]|nr:MAG: nucleoside-diphosphate kinase [Microgenomates group bacterium Gr01-1014_16]
MNFVQRTVVLIKPDGVRRGHVGEILARFEKVGLKVVAMKMVWVDPDLVGKHYKDDNDYLKTVGDKTLENYKKYGSEPGEDLGTNDPVEIGKMVRRWNIDALTNGPLVAILLEGIEAVGVVRKLIGPTNIAVAVPGTIRGDFSSDSLMYANVQKRPIRTIVHASGNVEEAEFEIKLWFREGEIFDYKRFGEEE